MGWITPSARKVRGTRVGVDPEPPPPPPPVVRTNYYYPYPTPYPVVVNPAVAEGVSEQGAAPSPGLTLLAVGLVAGMLLGVILRKK